VITEIYVENGVGREVMETINRFRASHGMTAVWQNTVHPQMQRKQKGDEWWIEDVASQGRAILTQDSEILGIKQKQQGITTGERQAVIDHRAHLLALGNGQYSVWDKMRCVARHWETIARLLSEPGPRAVVLLLSEARIEELS
jgi:hypothetical protein